MLPLVGAAGAAAVVSTRAGVDIGDVAVSAVAGAGAYTALVIGAIGVTTKASEETTFPLFSTMPSVLRAT